MPLVFTQPMTWVAIGIALLLLWLATYYLLSQVAAIIRTAGVIGRAIADAITGGLNAISDWALDWLGSAAKGLVELIAVPIRAAWDFAQAAANAIAAAESAIGEVARVAAGEIGHVASELVSLGNRVAQNAAKVGTAAATATSAYTLSRQLRDSTIPQARQSAINTSAAYTRDRVSVEAGARARAIDDVRVDLGRAIDGEASTRAAQDAALAGAAAATAAELRRRITDAEAGARAHTNQRVGEVEDQLAQLRDVAIPAALAAALAATNAVAQQLTQVRTQCIDPMCSTWGTMTGLVQSLMQGVELALVLGFVAYAVSDPEGAASTTAGAADTMHDMGASLLAPFIGQA